MGYTTVFTPPSSSSGPVHADWNNSANWSAGVPGLDATVLFPGDATAPKFGLDVSVEDLSLYGNNVELGHMELSGSSVSLTKSNITLANNADSAVVSIDRWQIDSQSFVGVNSNGSGPANLSPPSLSIFNDSIVNSGTIGAFGPSAEVWLLGSSGNGFLLNGGGIVAENGAIMGLYHENVAQFGSGQLSLQSGGMMFLDNGTSINGGTIDFGGKAGTTLSVGTNGVSLNASLSSFDLTDAIDLHGLIATGIKETGTVNPTLQISGANAYGATTQTLLFNGDYSADRFHTASDGLGGTLVYVTQMTVAHPPGQTPPHVPGVGGFLG